KYCWYHRDHEHDTEKFRHLKNQIEDIIGKGHLRKYVDRDAPQERRERREQDPHQEEEQQPRGRDEEVISFSEVDYEGVRFPHDDLVVVTLQVELLTMKRILIDSDSSADILYTVFDQLRIPADQLRPVKTPLVGFAGKMVHPLGWIELSVVAGMTPRQTQVQMTFMVVDTPSPYNAIVGRP
ncbi:LOW QUALITY PROTEIN: hypothetical protein CFOL_v3_08116, partial [Cephalotus follicularis]